MKSDVIMIDSRCNGFEAALAETGKVAAYYAMKDKDRSYLQLCTEEMLSLVRSITGETEASFWLQNEGRRFEMHLCTNTVMDKDKRHLLISASTSRRNEAAKTMLGRIRNAFEEAMLSETEHSENLISEEVLKDVFYHPESSEWDGYERSVLRRVADEIRISVLGGKVDMTVVKSFA